MPKMFGQPREVARIDRVLKDLEIIWKKNPDLRFYQLLTCIECGVKKDRFYQEDDVLEEQLATFKKLRSM